MRAVRLRYGDCLGGAFPVDHGDDPCLLFDVEAHTIWMQSAHARLNRHFDLSGFNWCREMSRCVPSRCLDHDWVTPSWHGKHLRVCDTAPRALSSLLL